jgi:hypothetical protein
LSPLVFRKVSKPFRFLPLKSLIALPVGGIAFSPGVPANATPATKNATTPYAFNDIKILLLSRCSGRAVQKLYFIQYIFVKQSNMKERSYHAYLSALQDLILAPAHFLWFAKRDAHTDGRFAAM